MLSIVRLIPRVTAQPVLVTRAMSSVGTSFKFSDLQIEKVKTPKPLPDMNKLAFGAEFSEHMFEVDWTASGGWGTPKIVPLTDFSIHPAAKVFHYAVELYEGLKAYYGVDGKIRIFRPTMNMERMKITAERATLPYID